MRIATAVVAARGQETRGPDPRFDLLDLFRQRLLGRASALDLRRRRDKSPADAALRALR